MSMPVTGYPVTLGYRAKAKFDPKYIHRGVDYGCPTGTTVKATRDGEIVHADRGGLGVAFGIHVVIKTDGIYHLYAHLSAVTVRAGTKISAGSTLGRSGMTGSATGPHLHYAEFTKYHYQADRRPTFNTSTPAHTGPAEGAAFATVATFNLAAKAKPWQRSTFTKRLDALGDNLLDHTPRLLAVQETGSGTYLTKVDKVMRSRGYSRAPKGGRWRHIYYRPNHVAVRRSGLMTLNKAGTKHAAWAELTDLDTKRLLFLTSAHLSEGWASTDNMRISQARTLNTKTLSLNTRKAPTVHAGDFNSYGMVIDKVLAPAGFRDALDLADKRFNVSADSFNGRTGTAVPKTTPARSNHLDHIVVSRGIYVRDWRQIVDPKTSDHNRIMAGIYY